MPELHVFLLCAFLGLLGNLLWRRRNRDFSRLPPGPPGRPLVGHLFSFTPSQQYRLLVEWAANYGRILYLQILGQPLVVVSSYKVAVDLMEKRSANYSDRPACHLMELVGFERSLVLTGYGDRFRKHRRMFQEILNDRTTSSFRGIQTRQASAYLKRLLTQPREYHSVTQTYVLGVILEVAYGVRIDSEDNLYVRLFKEAAPAIEAVSAGMTVLDFLPWLAHVPSWAPIISGPANIIRRWRKPTRDSIELPFKEVRAQLAAGVSNASFSALQIYKMSPDGGDLSDEDLKDIEGAAGVILAAGTETTASSLENFLLAMVLFPEAQRKAQEEIDRVMGQDRLPDFSDRDDLPYVEALMEEVARWHPVAPLAIPHRTMNDDVYDGMYIPSGSIIIPNVQVMAKDSAVYRDPENFYPERYLPSPAGYGEPPFDAAFGFGRRICPGRYVAKDSVWIAGATILATLDILKAVSPDGKVIEPRVEWVTDAQTSPPKYFECCIKPRSKKAERLIMESASM